MGKSFRKILSPLPKNHGIQDLGGGLLDVRRIKSDRPPGYQGETQADIDAGLAPWNPSMLAEGGVAPRVGTGTRPMNMPAWARGMLQPLQPAYDREAAQEAADIAAALRAAPAAPAAPTAPV